jgi:hypothetical protein
MPGFILHSGALVMCSHFGQATSPTPFPRVTVSGQPVTVQPVPYVVAGCGLGTTSSPPCVSANWVTAALRVKAGGMPVLLQTSAAVCVPTGAPLTVVMTQTRASGT